MDKDSLRKLLLKLGFEDEVIDDIVVFADNEIDAKYLYEKIKYLSDLKCTGRIIRIIIEENPIFLNTEFGNIKDVINYLKEKGLEKYIVNILEVNPYILSVSLEVIKNNEKVLGYLLNENSMKRIFIDRSELLTYNNNFLTNRIRLLVENGLKDKIEKIIITNPEIFELEDDEIDIKKLKAKL